MPSNVYPWLIAAFLTFPLMTVADEASVDTEIDEIIVTADFRERSNSEVPASVTVMDAAFVADNAVQHFEELVNLVPNLNWSGDGHRARYFQIRGVGELEQYQGAPNPSVGFLIDDIDFSGISTVATLFDMQSVEVLRGSQGSRYGANALGGLIYMRSTKPGREQGNIAKLSFGDDDTVSLGFAYGGSFNAAETASFRVSAHKHKSNGFRKNTFLKRNDTNSRDEASLRARLSFDMPSVEANVAFIYSRIDNGYDAFALDNSYTMLSDKPGKDAQESLGASLRLDWHSVADGSLTSITSVANSEVDFSFDADWGNDVSWAPVLYDYFSDSDRERQTLSQELRYIEESWLVGLYALRLEDDLGTLSTGEYYDPFYDFGEHLNAPFDSNYEASNVAVFAQYNNDIGTATRMSAGLRAEWRTTDYADTDGFTGSPSDSLWGGELSIGRDVNDVVTGFALVSRGYKAGGFNLGPVPDGLRYFGEEAMWTIESGIKAALSSDTLLMNLSVFHSWREDQQVRMSFQLVPGDPTTFTFATFNIDQATSYGSEAEIRWQPDSNFGAYLNIGLLYGSIDKVPPQPMELSSLLGRDQAHAPRYMLAAGLAYIHPTGWFARLDATSKDEFYFDVSHDQKSEAFSLLNLRTGFESEDWSFAVWARNLTDKQYAVRGFYFGNEPPDFPVTLYTRLGDPRQIGVTIERRF